jgi:hypothetical protein
MPTGPQIVIEAAEDLLKSLGWSVSDLAYYHQGQRVWQVYAYRRRQKIVTRAPTKWESWHAAARMAERLEQTRR